MMTAGISFWMATSALVTSGAVGSAGAAKVSTLTMRTVRATSDGQMNGGVAGGRTIVSG